MLPGKSDKSCQFGKNKIMRDDEHKYSDEFPEIVLKYRTSKREQRSIFELFEGKKMLSRRLFEYMHGLFRQIVISHAHQLLSITYHCRALLIILSED